MPNQTAPLDPTTQRHLALLDEIIEIGMVLLRRLDALPPRPKQDVGRDFEIISRAIRRSMLLFYTIKEGRLPQPKTDHAPLAAERPPAERPVAGAPAAPRNDDRTRLDSLDSLDDISGPFTTVVASIVKDIQTALASSNVPADQAELVKDIARRTLPIPFRPEADTADLN